MLDVLWGHFVVIIDIAEKQTVSCAVNRRNDAFSTDRTTILVVADGAGAQLDHIARHNIPKRDAVFGRYIRWR